MTFYCCPECGETHYLDAARGTRKFHCGFVGDLLDKRITRCQRNSRESRAVGTEASSTSNGELARYRLALLDAAQIADIIASDMTSAGHTSEFPGRCRELARQLRAFAGHDANLSATSFDDLSRQHAPGQTLMALVRRFAGR